MKNLRQLLTGLLTAIGASILVLAAGSLSLLEGGIAPALPATISPVTPALTATTRPNITSTLSGQSLAVTPTLTFTVTATQTEVAACQKTPQDWAPYVVKAGDTIQSLAEQIGHTTDEILNANCLFSPVLLEGTILYLPFSSPTVTVPPALPTTVPTVQVIYPTIIVPINTAPPSCGRPYGWVVYTVKPGDNLYRLGLAFGVTQYQLQVANCLAGSFIYAGQQLYVPNVPTRTPVITHTSTVTPAPTGTLTPVTPSPSATDATATPSIAPSPTATNAPTATQASETATATQASSEPAPLAPASSAAASSAPASSAPAPSAAAPLAPASLAPAPLAAAPSAAVTASETPQPTVSGAPPALIQAEPLQPPAR